MKICDKCRKKKVEKNLKINNKDYELCFDCYNRIVRWLDTPGDGRGLINLFGGEYS